MDTSDHSNGQAPPQPAAAAAPEEPPRGVTLALFEDLEAVPAPAPAAAGRGASRGPGRARRGAAAAVHGPAPAAGPGHGMHGTTDTAATAPAPARDAGSAGSPPDVPAADAGVREPAHAARDATPERLAGATADAPGRAVEQALLALAPEQLQGVVGRVATAIVRSAEFQVALRAQLYTLVAPAITDALRDALSVQEIRQSLREAFLPGAAAAQAAPLAREPLPHTAPPRMAHAVPPALDVTAEPAGDAVLLAGYEPAVARSYKSALSEAGYEALIAEIGPNDQSLPPEVVQCGIACLPDDVVEHVESVVSRYAFRQVLHLSATARRLVEAVELVLPLPQPRH